MAHAEDENAVAGVVEKFRQAMVSGDESMLESLAAEEFSYGHFTGAIDNKMTFIEPLANGRINFTRIDLLNQTV